MTTSQQWFDAASVLREHAAKFEAFGRRERKIESAPVVEDASQTLARVQLALDELEEAYANRQHGQVAQDQCLWKIREALNYQRP